jgi:hypothetical protein
VFASKQAPVEAHQLHGRGSDKTPSELSNTHSEQREKSAQELAATTCEAAASKKMDATTTLLIILSNITFLRLLVGSGRRHGNSQIFTANPTQKEVQCNTTQVSPSPQQQFGQASELIKLALCLY